MHRAILASLITAPLFAADAPVPAKIEFNRDVRPILADTCFKCHGFDKNTREADFRLDVRDAAVKDLGGYHAIVPGKVEASELWKRINDPDEDDVMPPKKEAKQLSARDKAVLKKWIEQGAEYQAHWAYLAPQKPAVPGRSAQSPVPSAQKESPGLSTNPVDALLAARHAELGLKMAPAADPATLARRLYFDLTGLPPKPEEVDAFVAAYKSNTPNRAYEDLVDRLLASPHFGERMAMWWLDLVRFADTIGYHSDNPRDVWPYRDYVIRAFNENKRFNVFTIEQVAGDLLPDATQQTRVASAYNRLILTTEEGGAQAKQYEAKHVVDRVKSIGTTWLAQTFMCAECHDHKFDPVTTRDFYALGAFFADIQESSLGGHKTGIMTVAMPEQEAKMKGFDAKLAALNAKLLAPDAALETAQHEWEAEVLNGGADVAWVPLKPSDMKAKSKFTLRDDATIKVELAGNPAEDDYVLTVALPKGTTGLKLDALPSGSLPSSGPGRHANGNFVINEVVIERDGKPLKIATATATFEQDGYPAKNAADGKKGKDNGWAVMGTGGKESALYLQFAEPAAEGVALVTLVQQHGTNHTLGKFRLSTTTDKRPVRAPGTAVPPEILAALKLEPTERAPEQKQKVLAHFRGLAAGMAELRKEIAGVQAQRAEIEKSLPKVLTSQSGAPRTVRVLPRGDWMSDKGDVMLPATPAFLPAQIVSKDGKRATRLDLARWLVSRENPLTARVFMNRMWKQFFGIGLSKTLEDMGTQSELPVNQPLLDWLAVEFQDRGWDVKAMVRLLVTSRAYQQTSVAPPELLARDPFNREVARQSRWRLDAEFVRDNALSVAGLLVPKVGGPSVNPYQPAGYWENLNFPTREWQNSKDENQWRRGLYTFWQRSYPHPMMVAFDAPTREECAADRVRSNIPQQALALLNDPQFVEAARALAARMIKEGGATPETRIAWAWKHATGRLPREDEISTLNTLLYKHLTAFNTDPKAATSLLGVGITPAPKEAPAGELAAYTSIARAILNLHETVSRL